MPAGPHWHRLTILLLGLLILLPVTTQAGRLRLLFEPAALASLDPRLGPLPDGSFLDTGRLVNACNTGANAEVSVYDPGSNRCLARNQVSPTEFPGDNAAVSGASGSVTEVLASGQLVIFDLPTGALCIPGSCVVTNEGDFLGTAIIAIIGHFRATPKRMVAGVVSTLDWSATSATMCNIDGIGSVPNIGSVLVSPVTAAEYTLNCVSSSGTTQAAITTITILPQSIFSGGFE